MIVGFSAWLAFRLWAPLPNPCGARLVRASNSAGPWGDPTRWASSRETQVGDLVFRATPTTRGWPGEVVSVDLGGACPKERLTLGTMFHKGLFSPPAVTIQRAANGASRYRVVIPGASIRDSSDATVTFYEEPVRRLPLPAGPSHWAVFVLYGIACVLAVRGLGATLHAPRPQTVDELTRGISNGRTIVRESTGETFFIPDAWRNFVGVVWFAVAPDADAAGPFRAMPFAIRLIPEASLLVEQDVAHAALSKAARRYYWTLVVGAAMVVVSLL